MKVRNHGKMTPIPNKIHEDQAKNNLEDRSYILHAKKLGFWYIYVPRRRHTTLNIFSESDEEGE